MDIINYRGNTQCEWEFACRGIRLNGNNASGFSLCAAGRIQICAVMDQYLGICHDNTDRQRGQQTLAAAGLNAGLNLCFKGDISCGIGNGRCLSRLRFIAHTGIYLTFNVYNSIADFNVDNIQRIGQRGDIQNAARLVDFRRDIYVTAGIDSSGISNLYTG